MLLVLNRFASEIGPGFIPDIKAATTLGFSLRDSLSFGPLHSVANYSSGISTTDPTLPAPSPNRARSHRFTGSE
jgi:hypothetical protein